MMVQSGGKRILTKYLAVLIQSMCVTHREMHIAQHSIYLCYHEQQVPTSHLSTCRRLLTAMLNYALVIQLIRGGSSDRVSKIYNCGSRLRFDEIAILMALAHVSKL